MTTKNSPIAVLKAQADKIAQALKAAERGNFIDRRFADKIAAARLSPSFKIGVVMDDKTLALDLPWTVISSTDETALSEYIVNLMRETRDAIN